jgi:hypothetical protein
MFGQRKRLRRLAGQMLLVWLFALGAGIVNACVLEPEPHDHVVRAASPHDQGHGAHGHRHPASSAAVPACVKFCTDGSTGPAVVKLPVKLPNVTALAPPLALAPAVQAALGPAGIVHAGYAQLPARIPISIAYLRLAL